MNNIEIFNIDDFISRWGVAAPATWFNKLKKSSYTELINFKSCIKSRKKDLSKRKAFSNCSLNLYRMLIAAIDHKLIKKSKFKMYFFKLLMPAKTKWSWIIKHKKLHYQWETFVWYEYIDTGNLFYKPMSFFLNVLKKFWLNYWKWIIGVVLLPVLLPILLTLLARYLK